VSCPVLSGEVFAGIRRRLAARRQRKLEKYAERRGHLSNEELEKLGEQQQQAASEVQGSGRIQIGGGPF
jgi:hypothetical protein